MPTNFLADYLEFNSGNEANPSYHMWSGLSALSACVSRKVWIDMGYFKLYPNLYVVLLGVAGNKKTTAMSCAKTLVREVGEIPFSAECQSKENLVKELSTNERSYVSPTGNAPYIYTPICIFVTELSQFIGIDPARMMDFLVTVYDQDVYDMKTQKHGQQLITGPFVSLLGCTVPEWITSYLKTDIITGGFSRRCIFVLEWEEGPRIPFPIITPTMREAWHRCVAHCRRAKEAFGAFTWADDAKSFFAHWYKTRPISKDPNTGSFDSTKFVQILKVAMLLSLSEGFSLVLTKLHIETAMALLDKVMDKLPEVFRGIGRNELSAISAKLEGYIRRAGAPVPEKELISMMWKDATTTEINQIILHMITAGTITRHETKHEVEIEGIGGIKTKTEVRKIWLATPEMLRK